MYRNVEAGERHIQVGDQWEPIRVSGVPYWLRLQNRQTADPIAVEAVEVVADSTNRHVVVTALEVLRRSEVQLTKQVVCRLNGKRMKHALVAGEVVVCLVAADTCVCASQQYKTVRNNVAPSDCFSEGPIFRRTVARKYP